jgi:small-conductance mechanosensitive channel
MGNSFDLASVVQLVSQAREYFFHHVLTWAMAVQLVVAGAACLLANKVVGALRNWFIRQQEQCTAAETRADLASLRPFIRVIDSFLAFFFIWIAYRIAEHYHWPLDGLYTVGIILIALTLVRLFTGEMENRFWARILAIVIWLWASLYIFHIIEPWHNLLHHIDFNIGQVRVSLFRISNAFLLLLVLYWVARNLSIIWRFWLTADSGLPPAIQILVHKLGSIFLYLTFIFLVFNYLGLDLTIFALFSGTLGLGLGFGLQKVFANLVSGFIILADKSIKPGDVIQLGDKFGWINFLGTRYTSVIARNGTEHLIPNENLVTSEVINWSYSNNLVRIDLPVGVSYGSDLEKARDLILETAAASPRVLTDPRPACLLVGFGDNTVNLELRIWINDPQNGLGSVKSNLLWGIWQRFREHGIELPFPQRDLHLKSIPEVRIQTGPETGPKAK